MKENENRPAQTIPIQGDLFHKASWNNKDKSKLSKRQQKVADLLKTGKHSAADISIALHYSDPRSYIREIRDKNICVCVMSGLKMTIADINDTGLTKTTDYE